MSHNKVKDEPIITYMGETERPPPAWYLYTFVYSKVLFLCQVSRADTLAQRWRHRQRRQGVTDLPFPTSTGMPLTVE